VPPSLSLQSRSADAGPTGPTPAAADQRRCQPTVCSRCTCSASCAKHQYEHAMLCTVAQVLIAATARLHLHCNFVGRSRAFRLSSLSSLSAILPLQPFRHSPFGNGPPHARVYATRQFARFETTNLCIDQTYNRLLHATGFTAGRRRAVTFIYGVPEGACNAIIA